MEEVITPVEETPVAEGTANVVSTSLGENDILTVTYSDGSVKKIAL